MAELEFESRKSVESVLLSTILYTSILPANLLSTPACSDVSAWTPNGYNRENKLVITQVFIVLYSSVLFTY